MRWCGRVPSSSSIEDRAGSIARATFMACRPSERSACVIRVEECAIEATMNSIFVPTRPRIVRQSE